MRAHGVGGQQFDSLPFLLRLRQSLEERDHAGGIDLGWVRVDEEAPVGEFAS
jgi:hypothetical protein